MNGKHSRLCGLSIALTFFCGMAQADLLADPLGPVPKEVTRGAVAAASQATAPVSSAPIKAPPAASPSASAPATAPGILQHSAPAPAPAPAQPSTPQRALAPVDRLVSSESVIATQTNVVTLRQLDALRSQNAMLSEMVKAAEFKAKLNGQGSAVSQANGSAPSSTGPQVVSVIGTDDTLTAVINLGDGSTIKVRNGAPVPGIGKVKSISLEEVMVTTKSGPVSLPFTPRNNFPGAR